MRHIKIFARLVTWQVETTTSWQIDKLPKRQIDKKQGDEMASWQMTIDNMRKHIVEEMARWKNGKLMK